MKQRTKQEIIAREAATLLRQVYNSLSQTQDLMMSNLTKMDMLSQKLCDTFQLVEEGRIANDGSIYPQHDEYTFYDDISSYHNLKATCEGE